MVGYYLFPTAGFYFLSLIVLAVDLVAIVLCSICLQDSKDNVRLQHNRTTFATLILELFYALPAIILFGAFGAFAWLIRLLYYIYKDAKANSK